MGNAGIKLEALLRTCLPSSLPYLIRSTDGSLSLQLTDRGNAQLTEGD